MKDADLAIIGGGIVGLATAWSFVGAGSEQTAIVFEKEPTVGAHQSGRNSGVLHSGIYYKPGSIKARTCREGKMAMEEFCQREGIDFETCGKVIVATSRNEIPALETLYERGKGNSVDCEIVGPERLRELEPHSTGIQAIHVPETGIVDYPEVCRRLAQRIAEAGSRVLTGAKVSEITERSSELIVRTNVGEFVVGYAVNCAGVYSDRIARLSGSESRVQIVPFRGEYFKLKPAAEHLVQNLIYPVPDPQFPFLGVHFTRMVRGGIECGPNAVLAMAREGYEKTDLDAEDLLETITYRGFQRLATRHWRTGLGEVWRSLNKGAFTKALKRLIPEIQESDLEPQAAGIRAQAVDETGATIDDFCFSESRRMLNVVNAPSPGATASLSIGRLIVERVNSNHRR